MLGDVDNVSLLDPIDYPDFVRMLERSSVVLSDSGGVQEEASFLEKPLLVLRDKTERKLSTCPKLTRIVDSTIDAIVQGTLEFLQGDCQNRVSTVDQKLDEYKMVALRIAALFRSLCE